MNLTSPLEILVSSFKLKLCSRKGGSTVELWSLTFHIQSRLRALYAQLFWITLAPSVLPRLLAQNWPGLLPWVSSSSMILYIFEQSWTNLHKILSTKEVYDQKSLLPSCKIAGSSLRSLSKIPHCCLPKEYGPCLSPIVADHSLKPAKDHRLGKPLPYQLPNLPQAHQKATLSFVFIVMFNCSAKLN